MLGVRRVHQGGHQGGLQYKRRDVGLRLCVYVCRGGLRKRREGLSGVPGVSVSVWTKVGQDPSPSRTDKDQVRSSVLRLPTCGIVARDPVFRGNLWGLTLGEKQENVGVRPEGRTGR